VVEPLVLAALYDCFLSEKFEFDKKTQTFKKIFLMSIFRSLVELLTDRNSLVRRAAVEGISFLLPDLETDADVVRGIKEAAQRLVDDDDESVRVAAKKLLEKL